MFDTDYRHSDVPYDTSESMARHQRKNCSAENPVHTSRVPKPRNNTDFEGGVSAHDNIGSGRGSGRGNGFPGGNQFPSSSSLPNATPTAYTWVPIPQNQSGTEYINVAGGVPLGGCHGNWQFLPTASIPNVILNQDGAVLMN